jgi:hypothetical protein
MNSISSLIRDGFGWGSHSLFLRRALISVCALPPLYCLVAMWLGGLSYPFWDQISTSNDVLNDHVGTAKWQNYFVPHNGQLQAIPRWFSVMFARSTGWDVGAELAVNFGLRLAILGVFIRFFLSISSSTGQRLPILAVLIISVLLFSPAGHKTMWWSFWTQVPLVALIASLAFYSVSTQSNSRSKLLLGSVLGWLAAFSMPAGMAVLISMSVVLLVEWLATRNRRSDGFFPAALLTLNSLCAVLVLGILTKGSFDDPLSPVRWLSYMVVFLGTPLASLIEFSFPNIFENPSNVRLSLLMGTLATLVAILVAFKLVIRLANGQRLAALPLACIVFALACGLILGTRFASAIDMSLASAGASEYTLFAAFFYFGITGFLALTLAERPARPIRPHAKFAAFGMIAVAAFSFTVSSYRSGFQMFREAAELDTQLGLAFALSPSASEYHEKVYPDAGRLTSLKSAMLRYRLGPYRRTLEHVIVRHDSISKTLLLRSMTNGESVNQRVEYQDGGWICGVRYQIVTSSKELTDGMLTWSASSDLGLTESGSVSLAGLGDWSTITLPIIGHNSIDVEVQISSNTAVGFPFRDSGDPNLEVAVWRPVSGESIRGSLPYEILTCKL